ncbi:MAG: YciI family protein [Clostridiaceae bacterium]
MLFMLLIKASVNSEAGHMPPEELQLAMRRYNEDLVRAGVRVMAKGLYPSADSIRISYPATQRAPIVTSGPFPVEGNLLAGFFLLDVVSKEEAVSWAMKAPDPQGFGEGQIELRQVYEG